MSLHPQVDAAGRLIQSLIAEMTFAPMTEQSRQNCRTLHRAMMTALNHALDLWANGELSDWDKEVLTTCARVLGDVKTLVHQGCMEIRRGIDT